MLIYFANKNYTEFFIKRKWKKKENFLPSIPIDVFVDCGLLVWFCRKRRIKVTLFYDLIIETAKFALHLNITYFRLIKSTAVLTESVVPLTLTLLSVLPLRSEIVIVVPVLWLMSLIIEPRGPMMQPTKWFGMVIEWNASTKKERRFERQKLDRILDSQKQKIQFATT